MNDFPENDPQLQSLEAQLTRLSPRLTADEQRNMLYQCAFAAGIKSAARQTRRWRIASSVLVVLLCGAAVPLVYPVRSSRIEQIATSTVIKNKPVQNTPEIIEPAAPIIAIRLDAWQRPNDSATNFDRELSKVRQWDATSRAHSLSALSQSVASQL